jgi:photosystem II stability/assembly factor-like uncharacterized protein
MKTLMSLVHGLFLGLLVGGPLFAQETIIITEVNGTKQTYEGIQPQPIDIPLYPSSIVGGDWTGTNEISFTVLNQTTIDTFSVTFRNVGGCSKVTVKTSPVIISGGNFTISYNIPTISSGSLNGTFAADGQSCSGTFNYSNTQCGGSKSGSWSAQPMTIPTPTLNPPTNLRAELSGNIVTLDWDAASASAPQTAILKSLQSPVKLHTTFKKLSIDSHQNDHAALLPAALSLTEVEPNNNFSNAQIVDGPSPAVVDGNAEISDVGALVFEWESGAKDDVEDLFKVTTQSAGLRLDLTGVSSDLDIWLLTFADNVPEVIEASLGTGVVDETIDLPSLAAGTYYVGVTIYDPDPVGPNSSPYVLTITADLGGSVVGLQLYNVYRSGNSNPKTSGVLIGTADASSTTYVDDVSPRSEHFLFYQITAVYSEGESEPSNEVFVELGTTPVNAPPVLAGIGGQLATAGQINNVQLSADDADGDFLNFTIQLNPGFLSITDVTQAGNTTTAVLVIAPAENVIGSFSATLQVSDNRGGVDSEDFMIEVSAPQPLGNWTILNPKLGSSPLNSVCFVDANNGWVVGSGGTIFRTSDSGATWTKQTCGTTRDLRAVYFRDGATGWAVGGNPVVGVGPIGVVYKTTNGGQTWGAQASNVSGVLYSVHFVDANTGWAVGGGWSDGTNPPSYISTIVKTIDGGATWSYQMNQIFQTSNQPRSVFFIDANSGWAVGDNGTILKTTDGGQNWISKTSGTTSDLNSVQFVNSQIGWAVVAENLGDVIKTTDGGESWFTQDIAVQGFFHSLDFIDAQTGWVVGEQSSDGVVFRTSDGGATWSKYAQPNIYLGSVCFVDGVTGWVTGTSSMVMKTQDGGVSWANQSWMTRNRLWATYFLDANTGWTGGAGGQLLKTTDAGANWQLIPGPNTNIINAIYFADSKNGWACQTRGKILRTTDSGESWAQVNTSTNRDFYGMCFIDGKTGWAVGGGNAIEGLVFKTNDGGVSWALQSNPVSEALMDVFFVDADTGWAVGMSGIILKTTNGGATWAAQNSGGTSWLVDVYFQNAQSGFAVGDGAILRTTDGGENWRSTFADGVVEEVLFVDQLHGWAVGTAAGVAKGIGGNDPGIHLLTSGRSKIWQTADGGDNWTEQTLSTGGWLLGAYFTDLNSGFAVGSGGTIYRYSNDLALPDAPNELTAQAISETEITLTWCDNSSNEDGFYIYRSDGVSGAYQFLTTISSNITSYTDASLTNQKSYWYRVCAFNSVGRSSLSLDATSTAGVVAVEAEPELPTVFALNQNYPNPFNPTTTIEFSLPHSCEVSLKIYNLRGEEVATLVSEAMPAGNHKRVWSANELSSGVYFYRLQAGTFVQTRKFLLVK